MLCSLLNVAYEGDSIEKIGAGLVRHNLNNTHIQIERGVAQGMHSMVKSRLNKYVYVHYASLF